MATIHSVCLTSLVLSAIFTVLLSISLTSAFPSRGHHALHKRTLAGSDDQPFIVQRRLLQSRDDDAPLRMSSESQWLNSQQVLERLANLAQLESAEAQRPVNNELSDAAVPSVFYNMRRFG